MKNKNIKTVGLDLLRAHPTNIETYQVSNVDGLAESITEIGLRYNPIVNQEMEVLSGWRRILAMKQLGFTEIEVEVVDIPKESEPSFIVYSNTQRQKSAIEIYREIKVLKGFWLKKSGTRTDLQSGLTEQEKMSTRQRIASAVGTTESTVHKIETIGDKNIGFLTLVDNGTINSLHEAFEACKAEKPKHENEVEEIDLTEIRDCKYCGCTPKRIDDDGNGNLIFKNESHGK